MIRFYILLFHVLFATSIFAQEANKVVNEENGKVDTRKKPTNVAADSVEILKKELQKLKDQNQNLIDENKRFQERLTKKGFVALEEKIDSLKKDTANQNITIGKLKETNSLLKADLEKLDVFKVKFVKSLLNEQRPFLELSFQEMSIDKLNEMINQCSIYEKGDAEIQKLGEDLKVKLALKQQFDLLDTLLNMPYNGAKISSAREVVKSLQPLSELQKAEVDSLGFCLARYKWGVKEFQNLINEIDKMMKNYRIGDNSLLLNSCKKDVAEFFSEKDVKDNEDTYFFVIPYLKERYIKYKQSILDNPLTQVSDIEEEIKNLKTE